MNRNGSSKFGYIIMGIEIPLPWCLKLFPFLRTVYLFFPYYGVQLLVHFSKISVPGIFVCIVSWFVSCFNFLHFLLYIQYNIFLSSFYSRYNFISFYNASIFCSWISLCIPFSLFSIVVLVLTIFFNLLFISLTILPITIWTIFTAALETVLLAYQ